MTFKENTGQDPKKATAMESKFRNSNFFTLKL